MTLGGFGIDLGTGYSRASVVVDRIPQLVRAGDGAIDVPSVVALQAAGSRVGSAAASVAAIRPHTVIRRFIRLLGRPFDHPFVRSGANSSLPCVRRPDGGVWLQMGDRSVEPEELVTLLIDHLAGLAEQQFGKRPAAVVFAVPPWFDEGAISALGRAAKRAKIAMERAICQAPAAALTLPDVRGAAKKIAIVDVGASGITASVVVVSSAGIVFHAGRGDARGGGDSVDQGLVTACMKGLGDRARAISGNSGMLEMLRQSVEAMKRDLVDPDLETATSNMPMPIELSVEQLEDALAASKDAIAAACKAALEDARMSAAEIDAVHAAGGMAHLPQIRAKIAEVFARRAPVRANEGAAAMGAALYATSLTGGEKTVALQDVRPREAPPPLRSSSLPAPASTARTVPPPAITSRTLPPPPAPSSEPPVRRADISALVPPPAESVPDVTALPPPPLPMSSADRPFEFVGRPGTEPPGRPSFRVPPPATPPPPGSDRPKLWSVAPSGEVALSPSYEPPPSPMIPFPQNIPLPPGIPGPLKITVSEMRAVQGPSTPSTRPATWSERPPSMRPPTGPPRGPLLDQVPEGRFVKPRTPTALLDIPCARPLIATDMAPPMLAVLLSRVVADARNTGILTLSREGESIEAPIQEGRGFMVPRELNALVEAFTWEDGSYRFEPGPVTREGRATARSVSMTRVVVEGLRLVAREFDPSDLEAALGERLVLAPVVRPGREGMVSRLSLTAPETRTLQNDFDGLTSPANLVGVGRPNRQANLGLFVVLTAFDVLDWNEIKAVLGPSLEEELTARAAKTEKQNHFLALGVHWSSSQNEIDAAFRALALELAPKLDAPQPILDLLKRLRRRVDAAYTVLRDPKRRQSYRREAYALDYDAVIDLAERRAGALAMRRGPGAELDHTLGIARELGRTAALDAKPEMDLTGPLTPLRTPAKPPSGPPKTNPPRR